MKEYYVGMKLPGFSIKAFSCENIVLLDHESILFVQVPVKVTKEEIDLLETHINHRLPFSDDEHRESESVTAQLMAAMARAGFASDIFPWDRSQTPSDWSAKTVEDLIIGSGVIGAYLFFDQHDTETIVSLAKSFACAGALLAKLNTKEP